MISDRDRRILAETERQIRREDPEFARRLESARPAGTRPTAPGRLATAAVSIPMMIVLLLFLVGSLVLGIAAAVFVFLALAATSIGLRLRQERDA